MSTVGAGQPWDEKRVQRLRSAGELGKEACESALGGKRVLMPAAVRVSSEEGCESALEEKF